MKNKKKTIMWFVIFILLIALTLFTIVQQNKEFSFDGFVSYIYNSSWGWMALAFVAMLGFIIFEGLGILVISRAFGYKRNLRQGFVYSATDIYFSAITPSATGGQPASAFCMMKDKIPAAATTIILLINLTLYTSSIIVIGAVCFITRASEFASFSPFSKILIVVGYCLQFVLLIVFLLLVYKEKIVMKIANWGLRVLHKIHLVRNIDKKLLRLIEVEKEYKECALAIKEHKRRLFVAFLCNLFQRVSQILVSVFVFLAVGGAGSRVWDVFTTQGYVVLGSNSVPIPGAVGAADYLFIDGFGSIMKDPVSIELVSRGISFYCCIIICGLVTLGVYALSGLKGMKTKEK